MSFIDRTYPAIVQDVLTGLTGGVTAETHQVDYDPGARPVVIPDITLRRRPVRRVSAVRGFVAAADPAKKLVETLFSLNDYELVASDGDPGDFSRIRFRPLAQRKPAPGTEITVNYYPRTTDPTPLTDLNVGSVTRTIVEALSRELAGLYAQLNLVYDSGFLETATGSSLDRVTALLNYGRYRAGYAVGSVTFTRRAGAIGSITIPAGTPIADTSDKILYLTSERYDMLAGESVAEVRVRGALESTPVVEPGTLAVIQRAIAGLDGASNARPTTRSANDETDEALRARTRDALLTANKGTVEAIRHGLLAMQSVRDVAVVEMPNGVAGEIRLSIQLDESAPADGTLPQRVLDRIEQLRPAGIRVLNESAPRIALAAQLSLVLAGSGPDSAEAAAVHAAARTRLVEEVRRRGVGERVRVKPLVAALLGDARIVDATLTIGPRGAPAAAGEDYQPPAGSGTTLAEGDVAFAADSYAEPPPAAGQKLNVEVSALVGATAVGTATADAIRADLATRLAAYVATFAAGKTLDSAGFLQALRNDALYVIDPLKLTVTLAVREEFVSIAEGGRSFEVKAEHSFTATGVELLGAAGPLR